MLKIAICDDNITDLSNMVSLIDDYKNLQQGRHIIEYTAFHSALDLIAAMESGHHLYDLVLLDILMPYVTGMDAAKEIRQFNKSIKIIFLTSSPEFALESYVVNAYYYALKPIWKDKLFILLDTLIYEIEHLKSISFIIKSKTGLTRIHMNKLEFAEIIGRTILYHMSDGITLEAIGSMSELEKELLSSPCFIKPHRSYIINMDFIDILGQRQIKMHSQSKIPLAKANYQTVKSTYITYAFKALNHHKIM